MTKHKTALLLGATGLVGKALLAQLKVDNRYRKITCAVRKIPPDTLNDGNEKVVFTEVDFNKLGDEAELFHVDHVYVSLGTTIKKAGSRLAFRRVDFDYIYTAAQLSENAHVTSFVWVSSVGAQAKSRNFYLSVKGEVEEAIKELPNLKYATCVQPSLLLGQRDESRPAEKWGIMLSQIISPLMLGRLSKYKPIKAEHVAQQMIELQRFE